jgi:hypothetical protein
MKVSEWAGHDVRLRNGDIINPYFNPAGTNGWMIDCFVWHDDNDTMYHWDMNGKSMDESEMDMMNLVIYEGDYPDETYADENGRRI